MRTLTSAKKSRVAGLLAGCIGMFGLQGPAGAAATGQPVAYALTPNNTVTVIDTGNQQILRTLTLAGPTSGYIVGTPDGKQLYVTGFDPSGNVVWAIDTQTYTVTHTFALDLSPTGLVITSDGSRVYAAVGLGDIGDDVTAIDTATNTVAGVVGNSKYGAVGIAIAPNGKRVYVPMIGGKTADGGLDTIDTTSNTLVSGPAIPGANLSQWQWVAVSPDSSKIFGLLSYQDDAANQYGGYFIFDSTTNMSIGKAPLSGAQLVTPLPNSNIMYGKNGGSVVAYNVQTNALMGTPVAVAASLNQFALTPNGKQLYVSNSNVQSIAIIDTATNTLSGSLAVTGATGLAIVAAPPSYVPTPPVLSLQLNPATVAPGSKTSVTWSSSGAISCTSSGAWSGSVALQGTTVTGAFANPGGYTFTLTCAGPGGSAAVSAKLTVIAGSTISLSATDVPVNGTVTASWQAFAGATTCQLTLGSAQFTVAVSGSQVLGPVLVPGEQDVALTCTGPSLAQQVSEGLTVYAPGPFGYSSLVPPNNNVYAFGLPGVPPTGGGLGSGYAFDFQDLQGLPRPLAMFGETFTLGATSKPSGIWGQTIALSGLRLADLTFLATAVNGDQPNQKFVVTYTDGTTTTFTQGVSDWNQTNDLFPGEDGYDPVTRTVQGSIGVGHRITPTGAAQLRNWQMYGFRFALDSTKVAKSFQLPNNRNVIVLAINETRAPQATAETISSAFNVSGLATVGHASTGPRLAHGYAFDATRLPSGFTGVGQQFSIGPADAPDAVSSATLNLPAKTRVGLTLLATGLNGTQPNQAFRVTYQDGSTTVFTQSVSDWHQPQNYAGELTARNAAFRITPAGARQSGVWDVYAYTFQTDPGKAIVSVTLPNNRNVVVFAVNALTQ